MRASASLIRTGSLPVHKPAVSGSPQLSLPSQASVAGENVYAHPPTVSLHFRSNRCRDTLVNSINRASSETATIRSAADNFGDHRKLNRTETRPFPASRPDEEYLPGSKGRNGIRKPNYAGARPESGIPPRTGDRGIATITGGDRIKIGEYYEEMLKSNPTDSLLLGNYGKFLHEAEKDAVRAEEYYGRAILANPGDGEVLSLYGRLIWETERDEGRAMCYFQQAINAAPDDCMVLASYAQFMWEAEEDEERG